MKQYNRSDHDKKEVRLSYVGLAQTVGAIQDTKELCWPDLINDGDFGPEERKLFSDLAIACGLTEKQSGAMLFYYFDHMTIQEIGAKLGVSHPTIAEHIRVAKIKLYPLLKKVAETKNPTK